jgi:hypothetical protein
VYPGTQISVLNICTYLGSYFRVIFNCLISVVVLWPLNKRRTFLLSYQFSHISKVNKEWPCELLFTCCAEERLLSVGWERQAAVQAKPKARCRMRSMALACKTTPQKEACKNVLDPGSRFLDNVSVSCFIAFYLITLALEMRILLTSLTNYATCSTATHLSKNTPSMSILHVY